MAGSQCGRESKHLAPDDVTDAVERVFADVRLVKLVWAKEDGWRKH